MGCLSCLHVFPVKTVVTNQNAFKMSKNIRILAVALILCAQEAIIAIAFAAPKQVAFNSADGKLAIAAFWFPSVSIPENTDTPKPVIIGLHGCGGPLDANDRLSPFLARYAAYFNAESYHFLVPNSFTPRGEKSICATPNARRSITESDRRDDVFAALSWLSTQSGVDMARVAVVGWSHGAQTVLQVIDGSLKTSNSQLYKPAAAVAFYPGCLSQLKNAGYQPGAPLLLMTGELDNWTPAKNCIAFHDRIAPVAIHPFDLVVYPGSYHGFDSLSKVVERAGVGNTASGKAMVGGNPDALRASHLRLFDFLARHLANPIRLTAEQRLEIKP